MIKKCPFKKTITKAQYPDFNCVAQYDTTFGNCEYVECQAYDTISGCMLMRTSLPPMYEPETPTW